MNYFEQVANMLGVKLYEEFRLYDEWREVNRNYVFRFTKEQLEAKPLMEDGWESCYCYADLFNGKCEIVKMPFKPKNNEFYWAHEINGNGTIEQKWMDDTYDYANWVIGNCFRTKKEAETKGIEIKEKIMEEYRDGRQRNV